MLTEFEKQVLRASNGEKVPGLAWGAAMSEAIEHLHGLGLMERHQSFGIIHYRITPAGREALKEE